MNPQEYRQHKDDLIRREMAARQRAQMAAVSVDEAKARGNDDATDDALDNYRRAVDELEDLGIKTGEFD